MGDDRLVRDGQERLDVNVPERAEPAPSSCRQNDSDQFVHSVRLLFRQWLRSRVLIGAALQPSEISGRSPSGMAISAAPASAFQ